MDSSRARESMVLENGMRRVEESDKADRVGERWKLELLQTVLPGGRLLAAGCLLPHVYAAKRVSTFTFVG